MCRMMAVVSRDPVDPDLFARFRSQARDGRLRKGYTPGHGDGWGIVYYDSAGAPQYAGRSALDASTDPAYPEAIDRLRKGAPRGVVLAHVRKASVGGASVENSHPFLAGRLTLAHNGTIHGFAPAGRTDSRHLLDLVASRVTGGEEPGAALAAVVKDAAARHRFSSATTLLSDGRTLWATRRVSHDHHAECGDDCPIDYYTLAVGNVGGATVVSQEHEFLGSGGAWTPVPEGSLLTVEADGHHRVRAL